MKPRPVSVVVPTLGRSPLLEECLRALSAEAARTDGEIVLVEQGPGVPDAVADLAHRRLRAPRALGFAAAANLGVAAGEGPWVALVNDDAVVAPGWLAALVAALEAEPRAAAAQGTNVLPGEPARVDGRGIAWNRWLQAVQLGHGEPVQPLPPAGEAPEEVYGVSATAAVYRREALRTVAAPPGASPPAPGLAAPAEVFDPRLGTYYEDVDLAVRLRAAGYVALLVPGAAARHAGGLTAGAGVGRWRRVYGNRYPVVARALGRGFWRALPRMLLRDLLDLARAAGAADFRRAAGVVAGWARAARTLPGFLHGGPPNLDPGAPAAGTEPGRPAEAP